ncbi:MAG: hypothetical protein PVF40_11780 [Ectothiorhodospiraceae bacterium]|jgi:hypothetical protein
MFLDDDTFLERFAGRELAAEHLDHRGHLRIAWLHLSRYGPDASRDLVCGGIRDFAAKFGAPGKFNHTLSEALLRIMALRMKQGEGFEAFLQANPDLVDDCLGVLNRYYSSERLNSAEACAGWLKPDREPLGPATPESP